MKLLFAKSKWEVWDKPTEWFLQKVKNDGFDATEIYLNEIEESTEELVDLHHKYNLKMVAQFLTEGKNFEEHLASVDRLAEKALKCNPVLVNCHPGKDFFTFEQNAKILQRICDLTEELGVPIVAETHRGRATYSLIETVKYLEAVPELSLAADFSHWMVVHESDLSNQSENLELAISRSRHIHARVGYEEGPQVTDPIAPEWKNHLNNHLTIWQKIIDNAKSLGLEFITITPEFGPPSYMHTLTYTNQPVVDAWKLNFEMKRILENSLKL